MLVNTPPGIPRCILPFLVTLALVGCRATDAGGTDAPPTASGECADSAPGWIWCDDFEEDRLDRYFEYNRADGGFVRASGVGMGGSYGMRVHYGRGQVDAGALHLAFGRTPQSYFRPVDDGSERYTRLYWRLYLRVPEGWEGHGGNKLSRAMVFGSPDHWGQAAIGHVWSGGPEGGAGSHLVLDPASGVGGDGRLATTEYNDFPNLRWLGLTASATPVFEAPHRGGWRCIEAHARLNTPGRRDGVFQLWIDGVLEAEKPGLDWVGSFRDYGWNALFVENYWDDGSPVDQERYLDNLVVSTKPIGCAPSADQGLTPP